MPNNSLHRVLWHVNRSPLRFAVKKSLRVLHKKEIRRRIALVSAIPPQASTMAAADRLCRDGYVTVTELVDSGLLASLAEAGRKKTEVADRAHAQQLLRHKTFWTRLLDEDMVDGTLPVSSPYVQFAIQPAILRVLAQAYGEIPRLDYVMLTLSRFSGADRSYSQLWHRDHDDARVIKLFVYLSDVADERDGPFTFIPGPLSDCYGFARKSHRNDNEIFGKGPAKPSDVKAMIAPALSAFMIETSRCLHMGSRIADGHSRLLYTALYTTVPSMYPGRRNRFRADAPVRDVIERAVLNL